MFSFLTYLLFCVVILEEFGIQIDWCFLVWTSFWLITNFDYCKIILLVNIRTILYIWVHCPMELCGIAKRHTVSTVGYNPFQKGHSMVLWEVFLLHNSWHQENKSMFHYRYKQWSKSPYCIFYDTRINTYIQNECFYLCPFQLTWKWVTRSIEWLNHWTLPNMLHNSICCSVTQIILLIFFFIIPINLKKMFCWQIFI